MRLNNLIQFQYTTTHYIGRLSNMFIIFKSPVVFAQSYNEAVQIADNYYNKTGEIVAVERSQHHPQSQGGW